MNEGLQSPFWYSRTETRGEFEVAIFDHGPDCECGAELVIPADHWQEIGSPKQVFTLVMPVEQEPMIRDIMGLGLI